MIKKCILGLILYLSYI